MSPASSDLVEIILRLKDLREFLTGADKAAGAVEKVGKETEKTGKKSKSAGSSLLKLGAATAAIYGAQRFLRSSLGAASDLNEEMSKTSVVFRGSGASIIKWSENSAESLGIARSEALAATGTFGNMLVPMGFARRQAAGMSKNLVQLAGDMSSFNNASPEDTLQALRSGLSGETEPLRRFGVFLNEVRVKAKALSLGLVKGAVDMVKVKKAQLDATLATRKARTELKKHGEGSIAYKKALLGVQAAEQKLKAATAGKTPALTAAQKAQATYALILEDTKDAQGDLARTSDSYANRQRRMTAQYKNLQATIGTQFLPIANQLFAVLSLLLKVLTPLTKNTWLFRVAVLVLVAAFIALKVAAVAAMFAELGLNSALLITLGIVAGAILILAALAIGFYLAYKKVAWFRNAVDAVWAALKRAFEWAKANWPMLVGILVAPWAVAAVQIVKHWDAIKSGARAVVDFVIRQFGRLLRYIASIPGKIPGLLGKAGGAVGKVLGFAVKHAPGFAGRLVGAAEGGTVASAGRLLVGERGPELVNLPRAATVQPLTSPQGGSLSLGGGVFDTAQVTTQVVLDRRVLAEAVGTFTADQMARR